MKRQILLFDLLVALILIFALGCQEKSASDYQNFRNSFLAPNETGRFDSHKTQAASADSPAGGDDFFVAAESRATVKFNVQGKTGSLNTENNITADRQLAGPSRDEELWVIAKTTVEVGAAPVPAQDTPGTGCLVTTVAEKEVPVPLKHTDVKASISAYIATVHVQQQFENPFAEKIEAVYVFPLPNDAAINEFVMTVGTRKIRGIIRDRAEATKIYNEARSQGYVASLLTQERPNIFTQRVANIEPGKAIDINITYFHTLAYADGWYEWTFPMVVGPRYNPAGSTDGVGAVGRNKSGGSGQPTEVQYLAPSERSGHDISLSVDINAGVAIEQLQCASHKTVSHTDGPLSHVELAADDRIPNKDFVLRYKVAGATTKSAMLITRDPATGAGYFTLMIYPPADLQSLPRKNVEMVFVMDTSGSMSGRPIEESKRAVSEALKRLTPGDTFQIVRFDSTAGTLFPAPLSATPENIRTALDGVSDISGGGGTEMLAGIRAAMAVPRDESRLRVVPFLTDGYIGDEPEILRALHDQLLDTRVFSFGIGTSVNHYLLDEMARVGRGAVAYLGLDQDAGPIMDTYIDRVTHPALTDIKIDFGDLKVSHVFPSRIPEVFVGRPTIITGQFTSAPDLTHTTITINGRAGTQARTIPISLTLNDPAAMSPAIKTIWARMMISDLYSRAITNPDDNLSDQIKQTALQYNLMSAYTAFLAVDSSTLTSGDHGTTVAVPVPMPEGVRYDTTVQQDK